MKRLFLFFFSLSFILASSQDFSRKDSLRGYLSPLRSSYDVSFYDLFVIIDEQELTIERSYNNIHFTALDNLQKIQIDLAENMEVLLIEFEDEELKFEREFDAVFIYFNRQVKKGENINVKVWYSGYPKIAVNPPWDGGFSWEVDKNNKPWIGVSCQGLGASSWWPCKDHQSDEPDSMKITCTVRDPLKTISNGNLIKETSEWNQFLQSWTNISEWFISYPINNYNVTLCIGDYIHFSDTFLSNTDTLDLDYYVLSYNEEVAKNHFKQVKPMLKCFEYYFDQYPFINDGYALIETPYLGMEHQSAIAYGNNFLPGYKGNKSFIDGLDFDFIILHETGHEWWGNSITTNDIADMWVHEGFCTYSEVLYVECHYGYEEMLSYVNNQKNKVRNNKPIIGTFNVNNKGSSDMYFKGSLMLHTLRNYINDDVLWFRMLKDMTNYFKLQVVDGKDIISYINNYTNRDFTVFFEQYLNNKDLPQLQYKLQKNGKNYTIIYRWEAIDEFKMPVLINIGYLDILIYPSNEWKELDLGSFDKNKFKIRDDLFFIDVKKM